MRFYCTGGEEKGARCSVSGFVNIRTFYLRQRNISAFFCNKYLAVRVTCEWVSDVTRQWTYLLSLSLPYLMLIFGTHYHISSNESFFCSHNLQIGGYKFVQSVWEMVGLCLEALMDSIWFIFARASDVWSVLMVICLLTGNFEGFANEISYQCTVNVKDWSSSRSSSLDQFIYSGSRASYQDVTKQGHQQMIRLSRVQVNGVRQSYLKWWIWSLVGFVWEWEFFGLDDLVSLAVLVHPSESN